MEKSPEERARDIFTNGVDYHTCCDWLVDTIRERGRPEIRVMGPMHTMAAFACELFLKSLLVDAGCSGVPITHDLSELVRNAPKLLRANLVRRWGEAVKVLRPKPRIATFGFIEAVQSVALNFEKWRYRHEMKMKSEAMLDNGAFLLMHFLRDFILLRHQDWSDGNRSYYLSAFQFPKKAASPVSVSPKASGS